jgi:hypothetical protein
MKNYHIIEIRNNDLIIKVYIIYIKIIINIEKKIFKFIIKKNRD